MRLLRYETGNRGRNIVTRRTLNVFVVRVRIGNGPKVILCPLTLQHVDVSGSQRHALPQKNTGIHLRRKNDQVLLFPDRCFVVRSKKRNLQRLTMSNTVNKHCLATGCLGDQPMPHHAKQRRLEPLRSRFPASAPSADRQWNFSTCLPKAIVVQKVSSHKQQQHDYGEHDQLW